MEFMEMGSLEKIIDAYPKVKMTEKQIAYVCFEVTMSVAHTYILFLFFSKTKKNTHVAIIYVMPSMFAKVLTVCLLLKLYGPPCK